MQTFLPLPSIVKSVRCLDWRRLGKQRVEARQILNALEGKSSGWRNHPATRMWEGYENALKAYLNVCIIEWQRRGYNNTMKGEKVSFPIEMPPWFGDDRFHASHRSNLLRKDSEHYGQFGWTEPPDLEYVWPVPRAV